MNLRLGVLTIGILLILAGVVFLSYKGMTYSTQENVMQIGDLKVTAPMEKTVNFSPLVGGASIVAGIVLVIAARYRK